MILVTHKPTLFCDPRARISITLAFCSLFLQRLEDLHGAMIFPDLFCTLKISLFKKDACILLQCMLAVIIIYDLLHSKQSYAESKSNE